jgi:hypothetical protein
MTNDFDAPIRSLKKSLATSYSKIGWESSVDNINVNYHDIPIRINFSTELQKKHLTNVLPECWSTNNQARIDLTWLDSSAENLKGIDWDDDSESDLTILSSSESEIAVQRDFLGILRENGKALLVSDSRNNDGLHNGLRWLLPRFLLEKNSIQLHSSAIIGDDGLAYLFVGQSGVGKSTMAAKANGRTVLGDDAIILTLSHGKAKAEAGALGQKPEFLGPLSKTFEIGAIFFLKQSSSFKLVKTTKAQACMKFIGSVNFPGWQNNSIDSNTTAEKLMSTAAKYVSSTSSYNLCLTIDTTFEEIIDEIK